MCAKTVVIDGAHAALFDEFIAYKRGLGYGYPVQTIELIRMFSRFLARFPEDGRVLTKDMVDAFCAPRDGEAVSTRNKRTAVSRQFAVFLGSKGIDCYIPPVGHERESTNFVPYIISEAEMAKIIICADAQPFIPHTCRTKSVYSMLIRMLWCCGLRLSEALSLTLRDVNIDEGILTIRRAKYNRTRLVPMSKSLADYVRMYLDGMGFIRENPEAFFFPSRGMGRYSREPVAFHIRKIMIGAGVTRDGDKPPRVHDIRHSFAVASLKKMGSDGTDIYCSLPMLSIYMGHSDIISTEYYLRLTGHAFPEIADAMEETYADVFPEVE